MKYNSNLIDFENNLERLRNGFEVAQRFCDTDPTTIYIIINRHIGDAARVLQMLQAIKDYYGSDADRYHFSDGHSVMNPVLKVKIIKKLIVITTKSISGVANLYSYAFDSMIVLDKQDLDDLELYSCSPCAVHKNIICDENAYRIVYGRWKTDEGNWIRSAVTGVGDLRWYLCLPSKLKTTDMVVNQITINKTNDVKRINNIEANKSVIICPYAKSSSMLSSNIWERYTKELNKLGYKVYTNSFGDEPSIKGTSRLSVDIDIMVCLARQGCRIIGVQSGLLDVLVRSKATSVTVLNVIISDKDVQFAKSRGALKEINNINNITYLRIEHFEEDYVLKLLMDNFH